MNALRSSPFMPFLLACALQVFIFSCCAVGLLSSPLRHLLMNALRSSPFISFLLAWALQDFMRSCCAVCLSCAQALPAISRPETTAVIRLYIRYSDKKITARSKKKTRSVRELHICGHEA